MSVPQASPGDPGPHDEHALAAHVLEQVRAISREAFPERGEAIARLGLDAALEEDFGLDSLGRAELIGRLEEHLGITLPDAALAHAASARDLLDAVRAAPGAHRAGPRGAQAQPRAPAASAGTVDRRIALESRTLVEVLERHARDTPDRVHTTFLDEQLEEDHLTYAELYAGARRVAAALWQRGITRGDSIALMLPSDRSYFVTYMGVLLAGAAPVPIYPPLRPSQIESHLRRHARILANAETRLLITLSQGRLVSRILAGLVPTLTGVLDVGDLPGAGEGSAPEPETGLAPIAPDADDTALIQYTSGSTGDPKGVVLTHRQLLANIRAMGGAIGLDDEDVFVSWLPLYHDMGLIGAWLGATLSFGARLVLMSPVTFLRRPSAWLIALDRYRGTLSAAPNFAYEMAVHRIRDEEIEGVDLGAWRLAFNGAEPVSARAMSAFCERFVAYGFRPEAMAPVFGLAECSLGLTFPPLGREPVVDRIDEAAFAASRRAVAAGPDSEKVLTVVGCGRPLPGYRIRILGEDRAELGERNEGRVQFQGPSSTAGYHGNPEATRELFDGEWLDSGDLGYLAEGELFITRRAKDMIIRGGRNLFPYELEEAVGDLDGVRKGCVAVFGSRDPRSGSERVVVLAETRAPPGAGDAQSDELESAIQARAVEVLGMRADEVVLAPANSVLKTSSGKIRRSACRDEYEAGRLGGGARPVWWQLVRIGAGALPGQLARGARRVGATAWGVWTVSLLLAALVIACPLIAIGPRRTAWPVARAAIRVLALLTGVRPRSGPDPGAPAHDGAPGRMLVANHASYMDWLAVIDALPMRFAFVAKGELAAHRLIGPLLRKLGTRFVERHDARRGVQDAGRMAEALSRGENLLAFPEGTFRRAPGLAPFRLGAFQAAARAGAQVVPIAIRGTRRMLPEGALLPRPGPLSVEIGTPLPAAGARDSSAEGEWGDAIALRDAARSAIAERIDEPLLAFALKAPPPRG